MLGMGLNAIPDKDLIPSVKNIFGKNFPDFAPHSSYFAGAKTFFIFWICSTRGPEIYSIKDKMV